jgi:hypothetical protein
MSANQATFPVSAMARVLGGSHPVKAAAGVGHLA